MTRPAPNLACVAGAAMVLSDMPPAAAADGIRMIREAVDTGLQRNGWEPEDAAEFAGRFVETVAEQLHRIGDAAGTLH